MCVCVFELFCIYIQGCVCSQGSSAVGNENHEIEQISKRMVQRKFVIRKRAKLTFSL
jgi:hypothetical protein